MTAPENAAILATVREETRGARVKKRRMRNGIKSIREWAETSGISREALTAAEKDEASESTYERIDAWLDRYEEEIDSERGAGSDDLVEFHINGLYGVREIIVKGPVASLSELESAVERLVRGARDADQTGPI